MRPGRAARALGPLVGLALLGGPGCAAFGGGRETPAPPRTPEESAIRALERELAGRDGDVDLRCRLATLYLTLVDWPGLDGREKVDFSRRALAHADAAIALDPDRGEAHYRRAVALGRILENASLPRLSQVEELEEAGRRAHALDPGFDQAGPCRLLALLYWQAPAWPLGPEQAGEAEVIEDLFEEALDLAPECVENRVCYAEWLADVDRDADSRAQVQRAVELLRAPGALSSIDRRDLERRVDALLHAGQ